MFNIFLQQITWTNFLDFYFLDRQMTYWLIALGIFILSLILRKFFGLIMAKILSKIIFRKKIIAPEYEKQFKNVISWLLPLLAIKIIVTYVLTADLNIATVINKILLSIFICIILILAELIIRELFSDMQKKNPQKVTETVHRFFMQIIKATLTVLGLIMILSLFDINVLGIITGLGLGGLAVSMAAKDYLTDLIAGFSIMSEKIFEIGDYIKSPDVEGIVSDIKFRQTAIRASDQGMVYIPNSKLTQNYVINYSRMGKRRVRFKIYLPATITNEQINKLKELITDYIVKNPTATEDNPLLTIFSVVQDGIEFLVQYFITSIVYADFVNEQEQVLQLIREYLEHEDLAESLIKVEAIPDQI